MNIRERNTKSENIGSSFETLIAQESQREYRYLSNSMSSNRMNINAGTVLQHTHIYMYIYYISISFVSQI